MRMSREGFCSELGCDAPIKSRGLCERHYRASIRKPPENECACGCGELCRWKFVSGHMTRLFTSEEQSRRGRMNTGAHFLDKGENLTYRKVAQRHEHRTVAEAKLGRHLVKGEVVHHINGNYRDNRPENLQVMTQSEHARLHMLQRYHGGA